MSRSGSRWKTQEVTSFNLLLAKYRSESIYKSRIKSNKQCFNFLKWCARKWNPTKFSQCSGSRVWIVKKAEQIRGCRRKMLIQSLEKSSHLMGLTHYPISLLWSASGSGVDEAGHKRDIGVVSQTHQVGTLSDALKEQVLIAPSDLHFFYHPNHSSWTLWVILILQKYFYIFWVLSIALALLTCLW